MLNFREGEIGSKTVGRREKLAQKVGRREIYLPVSPPSQRTHVAGLVHTKRILAFFSMS